MTPQPGFPTLLRLSRELGRDTLRNMSSREHTPGPNRTSTHDATSRQDAVPSSETAVRLTTAEALSITGNHRIQGPIERRQSRRVTVDLFVQESDGERVWLHPATNLSASGIFIESHSYSLRNAVERQFVDLQFQLPDAAPPIRARGQVLGARRVRGFSHGLAVRFLDLSARDRDRLAEFVARRLAAGDGEGPDSEAAPT